MFKFIDNETPLSAENLNKMQTDLLKAVFPIGSTYITQENTNPNTILGFGTWERLKGKVCLGLDEDDEDFSTIGKTGGEKTHTLTIDEMASHNHIQKIDVGSDNLIAVNPSSSSGITRDGGGHSSGTTTASKKTVVETENTGGNQTHNNMQPFEVVGYMWIRRA